MDGWITIGAGLDTKELEKDLKDAEKKLKNFEKDTEKLTKRKEKLEIDTKTSEKNIEILNNKIEQSYQKLQREKERLSAIPEWKQESPEYQKQVEKIDKIKNSYDSLLVKHELAVNKINNQENELEKTNTKIKENTNQQSLLNNEIDEMNKELEKSKGFDNIKKSIQDIGSETSKTIKKVARWALAIFSIRSAYMMVRSAVSTLSQYNEQFATDIEYIRWALANLLQPVIQKIINLVKTLLAYIGYIAKAWFGVDLFANSSAESFKKAKDNVSGITKEAKKLQKQLAGFDEMNILQEDGSTKQGGGGGGTLLPSFDLSAPEDVKIPSWLQWIKDNGDIVASLIGGIVTALTLLKLGVSGLTAGIAGLIALQIIDMIFGIIEMIQGLIKWLQNPTWDNFVQFWKGCIESTGILGDVILWLFDIFGGFEKVVEPLHKFYDWIKNEFIPKVKTFFANLWNDIKTIFSPVASFFSKIFSTVWKNLQTAGSNIKTFYSNLWQSIKTIFSPVADFFKTQFTKAWTNIKSAFSSVSSFFNGIINKIKTKLSDLGINAGDIFGNAFKAVVNAILKTIENILNSPIKAINGLISAVNKLPGIKMSKLSTFKLPRLASGAILSQPGRGVLVGGGRAIAGEAGREGYLPLDDSRAMAQLGAEIGRNVNLQATIPIYMGTRLIAREIKNVNTQSDFAFNR